MELLLLIVLLAIAAETTYLTVRSASASRRGHLAPVFVDTSVLIDGRIVPVAESGFLTRPLYIPRSVVGELQFLADNGDTEKRTRARHGLDVISQLQAIDGVEVVIFPDGVKAEEGVDNRLLELAKRHKGALCTIDYNLNKVAVVEGIQVLNVNELTKSLRMAYLPGEHLKIALTQKGNDQHQGIGHLDDGTMVVVEHASKYIGNEVEVEFIRSLQTAAGKMMFAKLVQAGQRDTSRPKPASASQRVVADSSKKTHRSKGTAPRVEAAKDAPARSQSASRVKQPAQKTPAQKAPVRRTNSRRRSPEDSMVELANSSSADS